MAIVIGSIGMFGAMLFNPSIADVTDIGGVIRLSAIIKLPPIIAGHNTQRACFRIRVNNEKIPPSPLLSARIVISTYFIVVWKVSVQKIADTLPKMSVSEITLVPIIALNVYNGEVPKSPNTIPKAINMPADDTFFRSNSFIVFVVRVYRRRTT